MRKHGLIDIQILEVLGRYGSDSKRLGQQQIISYLERDYNVIIGRAALSGYLAALREAGFVKGQKGYYRVNIFSDMELKILMDGVFYGKEIPDGEAIELIEKLREFSYLNLKNYMARVDYIEDLNHTGNQNVNVIREVIGEAIRKNRRILVTSCIYDINGNLIPHKVFTADPYRIVSDKCRYYLICHVDRAGEKDGIENRRLDRFWDVKILKDDICRRIETIPGFQNGFQLGEYMKEHVYMFSGESEQINIRIDRIRIGEFIDWYGKDYTILEGDENSENIIIRFKANVNAVYYWAQQYGKYVTVLKPDSLRRRLLTYFTDMYMIYSETDRNGMDKRNPSELERLGPKIPIKATAEPMGLPGVKRRTVYGYVLATVIVMQIPAKTSEAVQNVIKTLHTEFSSHFSNVFNSITADNGSEFDDFALVEEWSAENYFAHTYSSWNGL